MVGNFVVPIEWETCHGNPAFLNCASLTLFQGNNIIVLPLPFIRQTLDVHSHSNFHLLYIIASQLSRCISAINIWHKLASRMSAWQYKTAAHGIMLCKSPNIFHISITIGFGVGLCNVCQIPKLCDITLALLTILY